MGLKLNVSHVTLCELWDQKALHMRTSVRDHMLSRALLQKNLNSFDVGGQVWCLRIVTDLTI